MNYKENQMTLEEALLLIPTHIMLRPGIDKWQEGDEDNVGLGKPRWVDIAEYLYGKNIGDRVGRRPIPESVRKAMAMRLFGMSYMDNTKYINDQMRTETAFEFWLLSGQKELT